MKVIGFGDSILKGAVLTDGPTLKYSLLQAGFLEQVCLAKGLDLVNHARFGSTISVGRSVFDRFVHNIENGDIVLFEFGGNDCDFPWAKIGADADYPKEPFTPMDGFPLPPLVADKFYRHVTRELDPAGKENVLKWMSGRTDFISNWHERYNLAVFSLGREMDVPVVDITTPFLLRTNYFDYICRDGIHPNEKGHEIMAERLLEDNKRFNPI